MSLLSFPSVAVSEGVSEGCDLRMREFFFVFRFYQRRQFKAETEMLIGQLSTSPVDR